MRAGVHVKQRVNADAAYIGGSSEHANGAPAELVPDWVVGGLGCRQTTAKRREAGDFTAPALQALDQTQRCHVVNACKTMRAAKTFETRSTRLGPRRLRS